MKLEDLIIQIKNKNSFLCVGLDTDIEKIPKFLLNEDDPIFSFNKSIIDLLNEKIGSSSFNKYFGILLMSVSRPIIKKESLFFI